MHRTARMVPVITLVAGSALLAAGPAQGAVAPSAPRPISGEAADSGAERRGVQRYWTTARMEAARPLDELAEQPSGIRLSLAVGAPAHAAPVTIAPTASATSSTRRAANSQGDLWNGGGGIVHTAGRVFFTFQGRNASCSGNAVTSANKSVVITAGHCVQMNGTFHDNWVFVPGYDRGNRPHGTWVATTLFTTSQWSTREDINHDMGAAVVAPLNGRRLTDVVGGQGIAFNQPRQQQMYAFGYPGGRPYDGSRLIYCSGQAINDFMSTRDSGLRCNMTGGSSGGPWLLAFNERTGLGTQNSVNSFKYNFAQSWMFGPYFGPEAKAVYQAASREGAT